MSFMFHNFPLSLIRFQWNFSMSQNTLHMFTDFYNYNNSLLGNNIMNVLIELNTELKSNILAFPNMLIMDLIDLFYKKNNLKYQNPFYLKFLFNGHLIKDYNCTLSDIGIKKNAKIIGYY